MLAAVAGGGACVCGAAVLGGGACVWGHGGACEWGRCDGWWGQ